MRRAPLPPWRRLGIRLGASVLLLTALGIVASGVLQYRAADRALRHSLGEMLLNVARTGALFVDGELHEAAVRGGGDSVEYRQLRQTLERIQETNYLWEPLWTLTSVGADTARVGVTSAEGSAPDEVYRIAPPVRPVLARVLDDGVGLATDLYTDDRGAWISAFAPIRDRSARVSGVLLVNFRADVYLRQLAEIRQRLYWHAIAGALLAFGAGLVIASRITRPVAELTRQARAVVEGDFSTPARVAARDEIGLLGNVFHLMVDRLAVSQKSMVAVLVRALEAREGRPGESRRLADAALALGDRLGLSIPQREALELGALLHDVGEVRIPDAILDKPVPLTAAERALMEEHPASGVEILESVPLLTPAVEVVGSHHERWDGTGYPERLGKEEIPLAARVFAVVDALDAMTHDRPYRPAVSLEQALDAIRTGSGTQFDPRIVDAVLGAPTDQWRRLLALGPSDEAGVAPRTDVAMRGV
jgi:HD-GYP domain-containing protein (c-di-GMP phosphodiesterase class II)